MKWKLPLGLALSALFLWLAFRQARLGEVAQALLTARYWLMAPVLVLTILAFAVRAWRWRFLLAGVRVISFWPLFSSTMIGFMGNNVLPVRLGELLRAHSIGVSTGVSRSAALASVVVERIFDIYVLLAMFGGILLLRGLPPDIRWWGAILLILVVPVLAVLIAYRARPEPMERLLRRFSPERIRPAVLRGAANFRLGLGALTEARAVVWVLFCSLLMWAFLSVAVYLCFVALNLHLSPDAAVVVLVIMAIGTMIPSAPGYIGTLQYAGTLALLQYGVERPLALSFTLLYHASQWIPVTGLGLILFLRERLSLGQISRLADSGEPATVPIKKGGAAPAPDAGALPKRGR